MSLALYICFIHHHLVTGHVLPLMLSKQNHDFSEQIVKIIFTDTLQLSLG